MSAASPIAVRRRVVLDLLARAEGRFAGITFRKKDGSIRHMVIQPDAVHTHTKGCKTEATRRAVAKRRIAHPNLLPVYVVDEGRIKSINLDTVTHVNVDRLRFKIADTVPAW